MTSSLVRKCQRGDTPTTKLIFNSSTLNLFSTSGRQIQREFSLHPKRHRFLTFSRPRSPYCKPIRSIDFSLGNFRQDRNLSESFSLWSLPENLIQPLNAPIMSFLSYFHLPTIISSMNFFIAVPKLLS